MEEGRGAKLVKYCTALMQWHFMVLFLNVGVMYCTDQKKKFHRPTEVITAIFSNGAMQNLRRKDKTPPSIKMKEYSHRE